ncbi:hypothetical protein GYB29_01865 [bacterium]|nr:hypothetical protein [bacterium]
MRKQITFYLIVLSILVSACATPYKSSGYRGGYYETWISEREAKVVFNGNGYTTSKRAANYAAFRACELTLENGYSHFIVIDDEANVTSSTAQISPDRTDINPNGYGGVTATTRPGQTVTFFKPSNHLHIFFISEDEIELAQENGLRPISAKFFLERNAPESIRNKILEKNE